MKEKITLFVMGLKGYSTLAHLLKKFGPEVFDKVIYATDKQILNDYSTEIASLCKTHAIPFFHRNEPFTVETQYSIAISWRWLINADEKNKIIVCHDSLLPKYRGFAPLVNALICGDTKIGVTALFASKEYDRGDIINQKFAQIQYPIKIASAIELVSNLYIEQCSAIVQQIILSQPLVSNKQNEKEATYSLWRNEDDYEINWNNDAEYIKRFIDAVGFPYRGASTFFDNQKVRIVDASCVDDVTVCIRDVGKVIFFENGFPVVVCGKGLLKINEAVYDKDQKSIFPLSKFRIKFVQS